mmetsp:Transcript_47819/g.126638  ORF Transcript_47819/g.126638 Transcript_47819/m.126638 type:complete len:586 (-) Transcript_47819:232-1989(-)
MGEPPPGSQPPPSESSLPEEVWEEFKANDGAVYYFQSSTNKSVWEKPTGPNVRIVPGVKTKKRKKAAGVESTEDIGDSKWYRVFLENGKCYFVNRETKETRWQCPDEIAAIVADLDGDGEARDEADYAAMMTRALLTANVPAFAKLADQMAKLVFDKDFINIPVGLRESLFEECMEKLTVEKKKNNARKQKQGTFEDLLAEASQKRLITELTTVDSLARVYESDQRWVKAKPEARQRLIQAAVDATRRSSREQNAAAYRSLCRTTLEKTLASIRNLQPSMIPKWPIMKRKLSLDKRYLAVSIADRERIFQEVATEMAGECAAPKPTMQHQQSKTDREQQAQEFASARRRAAVQQQKQALITFFAERIRVPWGISPEEVRNVWNEVNPSEADKVDDLDFAHWYEQYSVDLLREKRQQFAVALRKHDKGDLGPQLSFDEVMQVVGTDRRFVGVPPMELQVEWTQWREEVALPAAKESFKLLLRSASFITADLVPKSSAWKRALSELAEDVRWDRLAHLPEERLTMVVDRIQELRSAREAGRGNLAKEIEEMQQGTQEEQQKKKDTGWKVPHAPVGAWTMPLAKRPRN